MLDGTVAPLGLESGSRLKVGLRSDIRIGVLEVAKVIDFVPGPVVAVVVPQTNVVTSTGGLYVMLTLQPVIQVDRHSDNHTVVLYIILSLLLRLSRIILVAFLTERSVTQVVGAIMVLPLERFSIDDGDDLLPEDSVTFQLPQVTSCLD